MKLNKKYKLVFYNHSCFSIEYDNKYILINPWIQNSCYNKSWSPVYNLEKVDIDFSKITHIIYTNKADNICHKESLNKIISLAPNLVIISPEIVEYNLEPDAYVTEVIAANEVNIDIDENLQICFVHDFYKIHQYGPDLNSILIIKCFGDLIVFGSDVIFQYHKDVQRLVNFLDLRYGHVDIFIKNASILGYIAEEDDVETLSQIQTNYANHVISDCKALKPNIFIPIGNDIIYRHPLNEHHNSWLVPYSYYNDVLNVQFLRSNDIVLNNNFIIRNQHNLEVNGEIPKFVGDSIFHYADLLNIYDVGSEFKQLCELYELHKDELNMRPIASFIVDRYYLSHEFDKLYNLDFNNKEITTTTNIDISIKIPINILGIFIKTGDLTHLLMSAMFNILDLQKFLYFTTFINELRKIQHARNKSK